MIKEFQIDISDLDNLKGISIAVTADHKPVLVFTYNDKTRSAKAFAWLLNWYTVGVIYCLVGLLLLWMLE